MRRRKGVARAVAAVVVLLAASGCRPGSRDRGFGDDGFVLRNGVFSSTIAPAPDGGVVVSSFGQERLWRVAPDGTVDPEWGDILPESCTRSQGQLTPDSGAGSGYILVCGYQSGPPRLHELVRITETGQLDAGFGTGGVVSFPGETGPETFIPLASGGYLGTHGYMRTDDRPGVEVTILDEQGEVVSISFFIAGASPVPPGHIFSGAVMSPAPVADGALVTVSVGDPGSVFRLDRHGQVALRLDGPWPGAATPYQSLRGARELPDGRLVVLGVSTSEPPGPLPPRFPQWFADVYSADGEHELSMDLLSPTSEGVGAVRPDAAVGSPRDDDWLWVAGPVDARGCDWDGACQVIIRYDLTTGQPDPSFGDGGAVVLAPTLDRLGALVPRTGKHQMYVAGTTSTSTGGLGTGITRIWDTHPPPSPPTPGA
jgi:hypothetical protein